MIDRWLMTPAPAVRLAVFRVLVGAFTAVYLTVRFPALWAMIDRGTGAWEPVGVLWWLDATLPPWAVRTAVLSAVVLAVLFAIGWGFRVVGPMCAVVVLLVTTYRSSGGQLLWFDNVLVLHLLIVGLSPAADALVPGRRAAPDEHPRYGWPLRAAAIVTTATYWIAGVAKLRNGGIAWLDGESLRNHVAFTATRLRVLGGTPSPLAEPLMTLDWIFTPLAVATLVIELGAPLVLFLPRLRVPWAAATWGMHLAIAATMFVVFPYPLSLIAFAPLFRLERLIPART